MEGGLSISLDDRKFHGKIKMTIHLIIIVQYYFFLFLFCFFELSLLHQFGNRFHITFSFFWQDCKIFQSLSLRQLQLTVLQLYVVFGRSNFPYCLRQHFFYWLLIPFMLFLIPLESWMRLPKGGREKILQS